MKVFKVELKLSHKVAFNTFEIISSWSAAWHRQVEQQYLNIEILKRRTKHQKQKKIAMSIFPVKKSKITYTTTVLSVYLLGDSM